MSFLVLFLLLGFLALAGWFFNTQVPSLPPLMKWLINFVIVLGAIILVLVAFGVWDEIRGFQVPKI